MQLWAMTDWNWFGVAFITGEGDEPTGDDVLTAGDCVGSDSALLSAEGL